MEVKPYSRYSGKFVGIGGFTYNVKLFPDEITLVANIVDVETENHIIDLINKKKDIEVKQIKRSLVYFI